MQGPGSVFFSLLSSSATAAKLALSIHPTVWIYAPAPVSCPNCVMNEAQVGSTWPDTLCLWAAAAAAFPVARLKCRPTPSGCFRTACTRRLKTHTRLFGDGTCLVWHICALGSHPQTEKLPIMVRLYLTRRHPIPGWVVCTQCTCGADTPFSSGESFGINPARAARGSAPSLRCTLPLLHPKAARSPALVPCQLQPGLEGARVSPYGAGRRLSADSRGPPTPGAWSAHSGAGLALAPLKVDRSGSLLGSVVASPSPRALPPPPPPLSLCLMPGHSLRVCHCTEANARP